MPISCAAIFTFPYVSDTKAGIGGATSLHVGTLGVSTSGCGEGGGVPTQLATDKEYILIVNNDPAMMKALCRLFRRLGQAVAAATSHRGALEKMRRMPVKLVVADVDMPGLDGLDFFDRARDLRPNVAFIALGSWRDRARKHRLRNGSTVFSLTKPLKKGELLAVARRAIARPAKG